MNKASLILVAFSVLFHQVARLMGAQSLSDVLALVAGRVQTVVYAEGPEGGALHTAGHVALGTALLAVGSVTVVVWMVGHAFDVLALVSPFPFLDLLLKGFRNAIRSPSGDVGDKLEVGPGRFIGADPGLSRAGGMGLPPPRISCPILLGPAASADHGMALGTSPDKPIFAFAARRMASIPRRTYGKLSRDSEGALVFQCALAWGRGATYVWETRLNARSVRGCSIQASCLPIRTVPNTG